MRNPNSCICENKGADQLCGNRTADQRLCFRYTDSTIPYLSKIRDYKPLAIFCICTARFVSDLVGNPEDRFSHNEAHMKVGFKGVIVMHGRVSMMEFCELKENISKHFLIINPAH